MSAAEPFSRSARAGDPAGRRYPDSGSAAPEREMKVLVVDAERELAESCRSILTLEGYGVTACHRQQDWLDQMARQPFDIVIIDARSAGPDFEHIERCRAANPKSLVIVAASDPSVEESLKAFVAGAWEYLPKPFSATHLQVIVGRAARLARISHRSDSDSLGIGRARDDGQRIALIGRSEAFTKLIALAQKVAATDASVFLTGESGTGKEVIAQLLHRESLRSGKEMVSLNCAALPEQLLESEMFGHRKGSFTGAIRDKAGLLEIADGGTMFLDELTEMPQTIQAKLLRVIQDGVVRRVGSETPDATVNVRFIAATNRDPFEAMAEGTLRKDLYYRLRVIPLRIPPLRDRRDDIGAIASHFLTQYWLRHRTRDDVIPKLSDDAIEVLQNWPWPGNVRELQNVIEHTVVLVDAKEEIAAEDIQFTHPASAEIQLGGGSPDFGGWNFEGLGYHAGREEVVGMYEKQYLEWLIERASSNMSKAARIAGVDRTTLYRLMEKHGFKRGVIRSDS